MIGLDTNVLVRYLTQDDPVQARKVTRIIEEGAERNTPFFISSVVLCELVWVLESAYGYGRREVAGVLKQILRTDQFRFEDKDLLWQSLADYRRQRGDFSDYLIGRTGEKAGCEQTLTFDRGLQGSPRFRVV